MTDRMKDDANRQRDLEAEGLADRMKGKGNKAGGRIKRAAGDLTGDSETQAEGLGQEIKGNIQEGVGKMKQALDPDRHKH